ncbi:MAG: CvpA family protein [Rhodanobacter sp.]|jgi:membrane protein required for colicin V production
MNWTDGVILGILGLSVLIGLWRGLVAELLSLVIWVAAFWVAVTFGPVLSTHLEHTISLPLARNGVAYGICFFGVLLIGAVVRFLTRKLIWSSGLTGIDRLFGVVFGFVRGALVVTLIVLLVGLTALTRESWWQQSVLLPQFQMAAAWLGQNVPASVRDHLRPSAVMEKIHPAAVLDHLHDLSGSLRTPTFGLPAGPVAPRSTASPAAAASAAAHPGHP